MEKGIIWGKMIGKNAKGNKDEVRNAIWMKQK